MLKESAKLAGWFAAFNLLDDEKEIEDLFSKIFSQDLQVETDDGIKNYNQWLEICKNMISAGVKISDYKILKEEQKEDSVKVKYTAKITKPVTTGIFRNGLYVLAETETPELYSNMAKNT